MKKHLLIFATMLCTFALMSQGAPANDDCEAAIDIDALFHNEPGNIYTSEIFTNVGATVGDDDPTSGLDCWLEIEIDGGDTDPRNQTVWFSFLGDGLMYNILTSDCGGLAKNYIFGGDTQLGILTGDCGDFDEVVACNEDSENIDFDDPDWNNWYAEVDFQTTDGEDYLMLIDGLDWSIFGGDEGVAEGEFCFEVTQITTSIKDFNQVQISLYPNPTNDWIQIDSNTAMQSADIYNYGGNHVQSYSLISTTKQRLDVSSLSQGVYTVVLKTNDGISYQRIVIE
jgi:hypothetical protein